MRTNYFLSIVLSLMLAACGKEKSATPVVSEKMKLLTEKEWIVVKAEEKIGSAIWEDLFPQFPLCIKDNRFKFNTNLTVLYSEGLNACTPNKPNDVIDTQTWKFNANETEIIIDDVVHKIIELDASKLITVTTETIGGVTNENKATYGH